MKKRNRVQLAGVVLSRAAERPSTTHELRKLVGTNYRNFQDLLGDLERRQLLQREGETFAATSAGHAALKKISALDGVLWDATDG